MGYYIQTENKTGQHHNKAQAIVDLYGGRIVSEDEAAKLVDSDGVIVVVNNGLFEAAAFAYDMQEFKAFTGPYDVRPKQFVVIDRDLARKLTSFPR